MVPLRLFVVRIASSWVASAGGEADANLSTSGLEAKGYVSKRLIAATLKIRTLLAALTREYYLAWPRNVPGRMVSSSQPYALAREAV